MRRHIPLIVLTIAALLPFAGFSTYVMHILILVFIWTTIGMAWNLLGGYCGQVSFGHAAYFGVGAYTAGILYAKLGMSPWWGIPFSIVIVGIFALILGFIVLRLRGPFFALATLASGEVMRITAENLVGFTGGSLGIMVQERTWVGKLWYYYIILLIASATYFLVKKLIESKLGYYFVAIREDQDAAESLGINTTFYKTIALCLSGTITGIAGAFYTNYMGYIDPNVVFALHDISIIAIMIVMVGGVATYLGPFVGAIIMVVLAEFIRSLPGLGTAYQTLFGILLIVIVIYLPNGIVGDFPKLSRVLSRMVRTSR
ncbi:MAG TPA: branched-chain amino acid ABC transporter permease [Thermodesulfovibrionales bacterium]|nr:branched-chain amino acid ABC transporter permease [Thermodesulfovibrionales bacterium]